jgi:hypothetical protein
MDNRAAEASSRHDNATPDIRHMLLLIDEVKVAVRSLSEMVPDPQAVEGLNQYVRESLDTIADELALLLP